MGIAQQIASHALRGLLEGTAQLAPIDVRAPGKPTSAHMPDASGHPCRQRAFRMATAVPVPHVRVVLDDDDDRRAELAAATVERMGDTWVAVLAGGSNRRATQGSPTAWGRNVISKDVGETMEVVHHVPESEATALHALLE